MTACWSRSVVNLFLLVPALSYDRCKRWRGLKFLTSTKGEETGAYRVSVGKPDGTLHWGDLGVDGWIILGWISRRWDVDWIGLAQDCDRWRALVSAVMNLRVPWFSLNCSCIVP